MTSINSKLAKYFASGIATISILTGTIGIISPASAATFSVNGTFNDRGILSGTFELDENGSPGNFSLTTTSGSILESEVYDPFVSPSGATVTLSEQNTFFSLTFRPFEDSIPGIDKFLELSFAGSPENFTGGQELSGIELDFDLNRTPTTIQRELVTFNAQSIPIPESHSIVGTVLILSLVALSSKQRKKTNKISY